MICVAVIFLLEEKHSHKKINASDFITSACRLQTFHRYNIILAPSERQPCIIQSHSGS